MIIDRYIAEANARRRLREDREAYYAYLAHKRRCMMRDAFWSLVTIALGIAAFVILALTSGGAQ